MTLPAEKNTLRRLGENATSKAAYQVISRGKGNRQTAGTDGDQSGSNLRFQNYTANDVNQYTSRTVPGYVQSLGTAATNAHVLLWGDTNHYVSDYRHGSYFWGELSYDNSGGPLWLNLTNYAAVAGGTNADVVANTSGHIFLPGSTEQFAYDFDGNLTQDSHWNYGWDAENRLIGMTNRAAAAPAQVLHFDYDATGRRIRKQVWNNGNGSGSPTNDLRFVYDNWNLVGICNSSLAAVDSFLWGLDLSGSLQGAGGVGGLLAFSQISGGSVTNTAFACYDGNGNVGGLVNATDGTLTAQYEYGPFGEVVRATGLVAKANPLRFSTKYQDDETDLLYYGYRYYNASTGRWSSRDPIEDAGFQSPPAVDQEDISRSTDPNTYGVVRNLPTCATDLLGLETLGIQQVVDLTMMNRPAGISDDITPCVMLALLWQESTFKTDAAAPPPSTAKGIAQINDRTADTIQDRVAKGFGGSDPFYKLARGERFRNHRFEPAVSIFAAYIWIHDRERAYGTLQRALRHYGPKSTEILAAAACLCTKCGPMSYNPTTHQFEIKDVSAAWNCLYELHR